MSLTDIIPRQRITNFLVDRSGSHARLYFLGYAYSSVGRKTALRICSFYRIWLCTDTKECHRQIEMLLRHCWFWIKLQGLSHTVILDNAMKILKMRHHLHRNVNREQMDYGMPFKTKLCIHNFEQFSWLTVQHISGVRLFNLLSGTAQLKWDCPTKV